MQNLGILKHKKDKEFSFSTTDLKFIACFCMILHTILFCFKIPYSPLVTIPYLDTNGNPTRYTIQVFDLLNWFGKIAFPIFAFQIAQGCKYTKDIKKYFVRLLIFAFISQFPYSLINGYKFSFFDHLNVIFTFALAVLCIMIIKCVQQKFVNKATKYTICIISIGLIYFMSLYFRTEYWEFGIPFIIGLYLMNNRNKQALLTVLFIFVLYFLYCGYNGSTFMWLSHWTILISYILEFFIASLSALFIKFYKYSKSEYNKYWFYAFYPAHMLIIYYMGLPFKKG